MKQVDAYFEGTESNLVHDLFPSEAWSNTGRNKER